MDEEFSNYRTNNTTKILNDMNRNNSSLAIADINKYFWLFRGNFSRYVCVCMYEKRWSWWNIWSPLKCIQNIKLNLEATAREIATAQSRLLKLYTEELSS